MSGTIAIHEVLERLPDVRRCSDGWRARCPLCNGGSRWTLSLRAGREGRVLTNCFRCGCKYHEILAALGLAAPTTDRAHDHDPGAIEAEARRAVIANQKWPAFSDLYARGRAIREAHRTVDHLRAEAMRRGECEASWSLLAKAATLENVAAMLESDLENPLR